MSVRLCEGHLIRSRSSWWGSSPISRAILSVSVVGKAGGVESLKTTFWNNLAKRERARKRAFKMSAVIDTPMRLGFRRV